MSSTDKVKRSFSRSAKSYSEHGSLQKDISRYLVKVFVSPKISAPKKILDIGSGTGFTSLEAKGRWKDAIITAVDIAAPMTAETKKAGILNAVNSDTTTLPFKDGTFDLIISSLAFQWIDDNVGLFNELARVLKKGGNLVFSTLGPGTLAELHEAYDKACRECTGKPALFRPSLGKDNLISKMQTAGFEDRFCMFQTVNQSYPSVNALFKTLKGTGAAMPGRPDNPPRRDVLQKTIANYAGSGGSVNATYELIYISGTAA